MHWNANSSCFLFAFLQNHKTHKAPTQCHPRLPNTLWLGGSPEHLLRKLLFLRFRHLLTSLFHYFSKIRGHGIFSFKTKTRPLYVNIFFCCVLSFFLLLSFFFLLLLLLLLLLNQFPPSNRHPLDDQLPQDVPQNCRPCEIMAFWPSSDRPCYIVVLHW